MEGRLLRAPGAVHTTSPACIITWGLTCYSSSSALLISGRGFPYNDAPELVCRAYDAAPLAVPKGLLRSGAVSTAAAICAMENVPDYGGPFLPKAPVLVVTLSGAVEDLRTSL